jgi:hypothetical protein
MVFGLIQSYKDEELAANATALSVGPFTPAVGEILVIKFCSADANQTASLPTASGFTTGTITERVNVGTGGSGARAAIWTCAVTGSAEGSIGITVANATVVHGAVVERWGDAKLDTTPAVASALIDATTPWTFTLTTEADGSEVSYVVADWNGVDPAGAAFVGDTATPSQEQAATYVANQVTGYWLHQAAASTGQQTLGLSAPSGMSCTSAAIEVQAAQTSTPATVVVPSLRTDVTITG